MKGMRSIGAENEDREDYECREENGDIGGGKG